MSPMNIHKTSLPLIRETQGWEEEPTTRLPRTETAVLGFEPICHRTQQSPSAKVTKEPGLARAWPGWEGHVATPCHGRGLLGTAGEGRAAGSLRLVWLVWVTGQQPGGAGRRLQLLETGPPGG